MNRYLAVFCLWFVNGFISAEPTIPDGQVSKCFYFGELHCFPYFIGNSASVVHPMEGIIIYNYELTDARIEIYEGNAPEVPSVEAGAKWEKVSFSGKEFYFMRYESVNQLSVYYGNNDVRWPTDIHIRCESEEINTCISYITKISRCVRNGKDIVCSEAYRSEKMNTNSIKGSESNGTLLKP